MICIKCGNEMEEEQLNGVFEPEEILYTCSCGRKILSVEGLGDEILK